MLFSLSFLLLANGVAATTYYMEREDTVTITRCNNVELTLENTPEDDEKVAVVSVNGDQCTIPDTWTSCGSDIDVKVLNGYDGIRAADLEVRCDDDPEIRSGDAYWDQDEDNPDWVWGFDSLIGKNSEIYAKSNFVVNDFEDDPITDGECIYYPCGQYSICLDGLTSTSYLAYHVEVEHGVTLYDVPPYNIESNTNADTITIWHHGSDEKLELESDNILGLISDVTSGNVYLYIDETPKTVKVYYKSEEHANKVILAGTISTVGGLNGLNFARVIHEETKDDNVEFDLYASSFETEDHLKIVLDVIDDDKKIEDGSDNFVISLGHNLTAFESIGHTSGDMDSSELIYGDHDDEEVDYEIGDSTKNMLLTQYGIIIDNPSENGPAEQVVFKVPSEQIMVRVRVKNSEGGSIGVFEYPIGGSLNFGIEMCESAGDFCYTVNAGGDTSLDSALIREDLENAPSEDATIYLFLDEGDMEFIVMKEEKLEEGDRIEMLGSEFTLDYFGDDGISTSDEQICTEEAEAYCESDGTIRGCHQFDDDYNECRANKVYTTSEDKGWPQRCQHHTDSANPEGNCWAYGNTLKCGDEQLNNEDMCTTQPGCQWVTDEEEVVWPRVSDFECTAPGCMFLSDPQEGEMYFTIVGDFENDMPLGDHDGYLASVYIAKASDMPHEPGETPSEDDYWITIKLVSEDEGMFAPPTVAGMAWWTVGVALIILIILGVGAYHYRGKIADFKRRSRQRRRR